MKHVFHLITSLAVLTVVAIIIFKFKKIYTSDQNNSQWMNIFCMYDIHSNIHINVYFFEYLASEYNYFSRGSNVKCANLPFFFFFAYSYKQIFQVLYIVRTYLIKLFCLKLIFLQCVEVLYIYEIIPKLFPINSMMP